ncbi:MAG: PHP domain-containing protein [Candidatus Cloacimonadales bacterium]|jgi:PHP family Zn ribbon phosphoesterase|nr:PHP domain-containing protein [Candidatus Cloacimonadota bacterium]MDD2650035.1 PHP domain-containing protein [Candidatus Cloacimonadota bacterium]MDD3501574.1 PHP domain-containing protein [Candidatus Cloacimonadota bacterium]MDX9976429.1 PHP domain-containing protein [Candidatus Cloacimonadales bacterium]
MKWFNADLHIHSVLSPCGDLGMSPQTIVDKLIEHKIDIFSITDHNSMKNFDTYYEKAVENNLICIMGIEVQTQEEIHLLAFFDSHEDGYAFSRELYDSLLPIQNDPEFFGDQVIIGVNDEILGFEEKALINSSIWSMDEAYAKVEEFNGFCYPAHEDASSFSIIAQLGFIPQHPNFQAIGISAKCNKEKLFTKYPNLKNYTLIRSSDAHYPQDIASGFSKFFINEPTVDEIKKACSGIDGRMIIS